MSAILSTIGKENRPLLFEFQISSVFQPPLYTIVICIRDATQVQIHQNTTIFRIWPSKNRTCLFLVDIKTWPFNKSLDVLALQILNYCPVLCAIQNPDHLASDLWTIWKLDKSSVQIITLYLNIKPYYCTNVMLLSTVCPLLPPLRRH